mmetsp:Transcript_5900/g.9186  ORF Transcript_5900/g.9186 Transcript_5900/m.9186 type:complete len:86 (-) Transcript_5900:383-640(-)
MPPTWTNTLPTWSESLHRCDAGVQKRARRLTRYQLASCKDHWIKLEDQFSGKVLANQGIGVLTKCIDGTKYVNTSPTVHEWCTTS